jgi:probable rRNA maturation factor
MTMGIPVTWLYPEDWRAKALLRRAALATLRAERISKAKVSIAVVDAAGMSRLHQQYLGKKGPTDVLSFDLRGDDAKSCIDGEIVVCADVARRRAAQRSSKLGHAKAELALYVVHGLLHLIGYDDRKPREFKRMHAREDEILIKLGLGPVFSARPAADKLRGEHADC